MAKSQCTRRRQVALIGPSEPDHATLVLAAEVGALVARLGLVLVTGGRDGIMEAASRGCTEAGGTVVAVVPGTSMDEANDFAQIVIPTGLGWARNVITGIAGDVIVAMGGAAGTLSEIAFAWMYGRPILALSSTGGWAGELAGRAIDHRRKDTVVDCPTLAELERQLKENLLRNAGPSAHSP